jgi:hypothetical protein
MQKISSGWFDMIIGLKLLLLEERSHEAISLVSPSEKETGGCYHK